MKKVSFIPLSMLTLMTCFCYFRCKKGENFDCKGRNTPSNIVLYNKPLPVIQCTIQGKWKCVYGKGGIAVNTIQYYDGFYWSFANNKIIQIYNGDTIANNSIKWVWDRGTYTNGENTFTMKLYDKENVPWVYVVDRILDDTLILHDYSSDAVFYHFIRL